MSTRFIADVMIVSGASTDWSLSTPIAMIPASLHPSITPLPVPPAAWNTISAPFVTAVDNAVYDCAKATVEGTLAAGVKTYDITNGGVDIAPTTTLLPEDVLAAVEDVKAKLLDGTIVVPASQAEFEAAYGDIYVLD